MSVQGLCQVCESARAEYTCRRCGALVCSAHYDESSGLCSTCAADAGSPGGRR